MGFRFITKQLRICFHAILLAVLPCFAPAQTAQSPVDSIVAALRSKDFDQALKLSDAALVKAPNDYRLWTLSGMAYSGINKPESALAAYEHALKLAPTYLPALEGAAQVEYQQGSNNAKSMILRVLALHPDDPTSHAMLGALEYKAKKCNEAVQYFVQAGQVLASQPDALTEYGSCLASLNRYDEAVEVFQQVVAFDPSRKSALYNLALAQWKANHAGDALATLQPLIDTHPDDEDILTLAAAICESKNDTPRAVEYLRKAIVTNPKKNDAYLEFASLSYDHASIQVGIDMLNVGLTQMPNDPQLYLARGVLYGQSGKSTQAIEDFETANRLDPKLSFIGVSEGLVASQEHKSGKALSAFRAAAKVHPNDAFTQYLLAEALSQGGKPQGSPDFLEEVAAANRAIKLDPKLAVAHDLLATLYLQDGHTQLAISHSKSALAADPKDQQALYHLILALRKTDRKEEISALLRRLMELRNAEQAEGAQKKRYQLYEETGSK